MRLSYLFNGNSYAAKMASLYSNQAPYLNKESFNSSNTARLYWSNHKPGYFYFDS